MGTKRQKLRINLIVWRRYEYSLGFSHPIRLYQLTMIFSFALMIFSEH
jgi:hypothetical protein